MVWHQVGFESSKTNDSYPSFLFLPLLLWISVSYLPFIWHPGVKLQISADRVGVTTVFIAGDRVSKSIFPLSHRRFEVRTWKHLRLANWIKPRTVRRGITSKKLRHLAPLAIANGWLESDERQDDEKIFEIWKGWPREH